MGQLALWALRGARLTGCATRRGLLTALVLLCLASAMVTAWPAVRSRWLSSFVCSDAESAVVAAVANTTTSCVPEAVRSLPVLVLSDVDADAERFVAACFDDVRLAPPIMGCRLKPQNVEQWISLFDCGGLSVRLPTSIARRRYGSAEFQLSAAHLQAVSAAYDAGLEKALIVERDADLSLLPHWGSAGLDAVLERTPEDFHLLRLYEWNAKSAFDTNPTPRRTTTASRPAWGAVAYVVSRRGMEWLRKRFGSPSDGIRLQPDPDVCDGHIVSECVLFSGPEVYRSGRPLFGHQLQAALRSPSKVRVEGMLQRCRNAASSLYILAAYGMISWTYAVFVDWHYEMYLLVVGFGTALLLLLLLLRQLQGSRRSLLYDLRPTLPLP